MDKLTRYILGKHGNVLRLHSELSYQAVLDARGNIDLKKHIKQTMAKELAHELLASKAAAFSECEGGGSIVFDAVIIALTEEELTTIVNAAYDAGVESTGARHE